MKTQATAPAARGHGAFTLIECLVGIALVTIVVGALYTGMTFGAQRTNFTREDLRATQILLEKVEQIRLYRWDQLSFFADPDDLDDLEFDPDDPHVADDEVEPFVIPATFSATFSPGGTNSSDLVYSGTFRVTNAPISEVYSNDMMLVTVGLSWNSNGKTRTRQVQTLFAKYGLQNNIPR